MNDNSSSPSSWDQNGADDLPIGMTLTPAGEDIAALQDDLDLAHEVLGGLAKRMGL